MTKSICNQALCRYDGPEPDDHCHGCEYYGVVEMENEIQITIKNADATLCALRDAGNTTSMLIGQIKNDIEIREKILDEATREYDEAVAYRNDMLSRALAICDLLTQIEPTSEDELSWREYFDLDELDKQVSKSVSKPTLTVSDDGKTALISLPDGKSIDIDSGDPEGSIKRLLSSVPIVNTHASPTGFEIVFDTTPWTSLFVCDDGQATKTTFSYKNDNSDDWVEIIRI